MTIPLSPESQSAPLQASLPIDFLIVGGGIAGLACAIALRRVGHRAVVLERDGGFAAEKSSGGCRLAPNLSKIFFHWGLEEKLRQIAVKSEAIDLRLLEAGEDLGLHVWDEEVIKETRGEFLFTLHSDLRKLLYDFAIELGAEVRVEVAVSSVDGDSNEVTLASGEVLKADVIVGADGPDGLTRSYFLEEMNAPPEEPVQMVMYSSTVPKALIMSDPDLATFYTHQYKCLYVWMGNGRMVMGLPVGGSENEEFAIYVYGPPDGSEGTWDEEAAHSNMQKVVDTATPDVQRLVKLAGTPKCVPVRHYTELEDWVHESGKMVAIGQAAHPMPPGGIQICAMAVEDGAVLAKLFSHLRSEDQIGSFLWAFQDLRQPRCKYATMSELGNFCYMSFPPGEGQQQRDHEMRSKRDAGLNLLQGSDDSEESPQWVEIKEMFGYDAEDHADNWWVEWGLLRERANGVQDISELHIQWTEEESLAGLGNASN